MLMNGNKVRAFPSANLAEVGLVFGAYPISWASVFSYRNIRCLFSIGNSDGLSVLKNKKARRCYPPRLSHKLGIGASALLR